MELTSRHCCTGSYLTKGWPEGPGLELNEEGLSDPTAFHSPAHAESWCGPESASDKKGDHTCTLMVECTAPKVEAKSWDAIHFSVKLHTLF